MWIQGILSQHSVELLLMKLETFCGMIGWEGLKEIERGDNRSISSLLAIAHRVKAMVGPIIFGYNSFTTVSPPRRNFKTRPSPKEKKELTHHQFSHMM